MLLGGQQFGYFFFDYCEIFHHFLQLYQSSWAGQTAVVPLYSQVAT